MIDISNIETYGWEAAIRGMRNPMNSWDKSDSGYSCEIFVGTIDGTEMTDEIRAKCREWYKSSILVEGDDFYSNDFYIGPADAELMRKLCIAGPEHRKFMRMIFVTMDIKAPLYWWKEFDTYKVGTVADSCSTMHKIGEKRFDLEDFSCEHIRNSKEEHWMVMLDNVISSLNVARDYYLETKDKKYWWQMIQLLPSSYNQLRTVSLNYEVLHSMYHQRYNHKLDEWRDFCKRLKDLPFSELIVGGRMLDIPTILQSTYAEGGEI